MENVRKHIKHFGLLLVALIAIVAIMKFGVGVEFWPLFISAIFIFAFVIAFIYIWAVASRMSKIFSVVVGLMFLIAVVFMIFSVFYPSTWDKLLKKNTQADLSWSDKIDTISCHYDHSEIDRMEKDQIATDSIALHWLDESLKAKNPKLKKACIDSSRWYREQFKERWSKKGNVATIPAVTDTTQNSATGYEGGILNAGVIKTFTLAPGEYTGAIRITAKHSSIIGGHNDFVKHYHYGLPVKCKPNQETVETARFDDEFYIENTYNKVQEFSIKTW